MLAIGQGLTLFLLNRIIRVIFHVDLDSEVQLSTDFLKGLIQSAVLNRSQSGLQHSIEQELRILTENAGEWLLAIGSGHFARCLADLINESLQCRHGVRVGDEFRRQHAVLVLLCIGHGQGLLLNLIQILGLDLNLSNFYSLHLIRLFCCHKF